MRARLLKTTVLAAVAGAVWTQNAAGVLDEMVTGGALVTVEQVRVVKYAASPKRNGSHQG